MVRRRGGFLLDYQHINLHFEVAGWVLTSNRLAVSVSNTRSVPALIPRVVFQMVFAVMVVRFTHFLATRLELTSLVTTGLAGARGSCEMNILHYVIVLTLPTHLPKRAVTISACSATSVALLENPFTIAPS